MFASLFTVADKHLKHLRGRENLRTYTQSQSVLSGKAMTNHFCSACGTLTYRVPERFPGCSILRIGAVDDFNLHETKLRPQTELFTRSRVGWLTGVQGAKQYETMGI
jgi:hypothetical protein